MKKGIILLGIAVVSALLASCRYDKEDQIYGCSDTTNVTYSGFVKPFLDKECLECHSDANAGSLGGGRVLEGYANVQDYVADSSLYGSIAHISGYSAMPDGEPKLDDCTITKVRKWIEAGALEN